MNKEYFKLDAQKIIDASYDEDVLLNSAPLESIYVIRQMRALCALRDGVFRIDEVVEGKIKPERNIAKIENVWCPIILVDIDEEEK